MNERHISLGVAKSLSKSKIPRCVIRTVSDIKRNVGVQCDFFGIILENLKPDNYLDDEIKTFYAQCIRFINNYHSFLNKELEMKFGCHKEVLFELQEVRNYVLLVEFLKKCAENKQVVGVKDDCLKKIAQKSQEFNQLEEHNGLENQNLDSKNMDSGFDSKESSEDIYEQCKGKSDSNKSVVEHSKLSGLKSIEDNTIADESIETLQLKKEDIIALKNNAVAMQMLKQNNSNWTKKSGKTLEETKHVGVPEELQTSVSLVGNADEGHENQRTSLSTGDKSSIMHDEKFGELTSNSYSNKDNNRKHPKTESLKDNKHDLTEIYLDNNESPSKFHVFSNRVQIKAEILMSVEKKERQNSKKLRKCRDKSNLATRIPSLLIAHENLESSDSSDIHSDSEIA